VVRALNLHVACTRNQRMIHVGRARGVPNPVTVGRFLSGQQLFVEDRMPILKSLDGPQLQNSWSINVGWQ